MGRVSFILLVLIFYLNIRVKIINNEKYLIYEHNQNLSHNFHSGRNLCGHYLILSIQMFTVPVETAHLVI